MLGLQLTVTSLIGGRTWKQMCAIAESNCGEQLLNVLYQNRSGEKVGRVAVDILSLMADNDDTGKWETAGFHWVPWSLKNLKRNSPILYQISRDTESSYRDADIVCFYEDTDGFASTKLSTSSFI